jgi:NADPH:quinone reductase
MPLRSTSLKTSMAQILPRLAYHSRAIEVSKSTNRIATLDSLKATQPVPSLGGYLCLRATSSHRSLTTPRLQTIAPHQSRHYHASPQMSMPTSMHGVQITKTGGIEVLDYIELPVPELQEGEILVKNEYSGVNFIDTYHRTGLYKLPLPRVLGREGSGTVAKVHPSVTNFKVGDTVVYMHDHSYAGYAAVPISKAVHVPEGVSTLQAAASYLQGLTAWTFVCEAGQVKAGQWALVHAAAGGVGGLLVQMLKAVGAKVIGTAGSKEKCELARKYGAEWVIQSRDENIATRVKEITGGHGADVIFDGVGKATFDLDIDAIARKGTLVVFGNAVSLRTSVAPTLPMCHDHKLTMDAVRCRSTV